MLLRVQVFSQPTSEYSWNVQHTYSAFNYFVCSTYATESSLNNCSIHSTSNTACVTVCATPYAIKCYGKISQLQCCTI